MDISKLLKYNPFISLNEGTVSCELPRIQQGSEIPKIIHQTFKTRILPPQLQENVDRLRARNPDWEYRFYDDLDIIQFILTFYPPNILTYYKRINPKYGAARADLFRYLLLYKYGGVYLDIKSNFTRPIDEIIQPGDQYLLAQWRNRSAEEHEGHGLHKKLSMIVGGEFQQWHIICVPGHPFLRAVIEEVLTNIDRYRPWSYGTGSNGVLQVTGPIAYSLAIFPLLSSYPHRLVRTDAELNLLYSALKTPHQLIFKNHHTTLKEPIVKTDGVEEMIWNIHLLEKKTTSYLKKKLGLKTKL